MHDAIHLESAFERYISRKIAELENNGWRVSKNDTGFDPNTALYIADFIEYLQNTAPDKVTKMQKVMGSAWLTNLERELVKNLEMKGTVQVLRKGFPMAGYNTIECSAAYPDDPRLTKVRENYDHNILRVMHQVHYQTAGNKSLDLVFFINGIPVATAEVKTELTQTVYDAIEEYQTQRRPIEPGTSRRNYLLMFKRGAVVHFAISEDEIWMCTDLTPTKPKFLPFNKGRSDGHAGNDPMTGDEYPTGYFWNEICKKDNWLKIFHNFIFVKEEEKEDRTGRIVPVEKQLFPRFHQWDVVTKMMADVDEKGVGQRYLVEHSAGSGKTETISWTAHELIRKRTPEGERLFSSVIIVTDRIGLDFNIKRTIGQLNRTPGSVVMVGGDDKKKSSVAKNKELVQALHEKREIIVVTIQTFPFALEAIAADEELAGANFAVLIDEAHNSQEGNISAKMKAALKLASKKTKGSAPDEDTTDEDLINAYFKMIQANNTMPDNVSFFAFTATPKAETKTLFGTPSKEIDDKTGRPIPESFHLYPMRQAIEEGYIIDVLQGYISYKTAYRLKEDIVPDKLVDERQALRTIAKWANLHPTNVMSKAEFIVEHFVNNVAPLLDGYAKAMVVTASRPAVIRYKYAIEAYLDAHPEYDKSKIAPNLRFKVPGEPLVAFSGKLLGEQCIMTEDGEIIKEFDYLKDNPFAQIKRDYEYTEENSNDIGYQSVENAFDTPEYRMMIVADKFQTGFNQPKLCAMYIDKKISNDIEIVQTYSRLNRTYPGKDHVFIVDFVNDPDTVLRAFKKYDTGAEMEHAQDLNIIYTLKEKLYNSEIFTAEELEEYKKSRYKSIAAIQDDKKDKYRTAIYKAVAEPAQRWKDALKAEQTAYTTWKNVLETEKSKGNETKANQAQEKLDEAGQNIDKLMDFRKTLKRYCSAYTFISQIIELDDAELEVFYGFAKLLAHRLAGETLEEIDVTSLVMNNYKLNRIDIGTDEEDPEPLKPMRASTRTKASKKESLKVIVSRINEIWGPDTDTALAARTLNAIADYVDGDDISRIQIRNSRNSKSAVIADGRLEAIIKLAAVSLKNNDFESLADKIINDPQTWGPLTDIIFDLIDGKKRIDISDISSLAKESK